MMRRLFLGLVIVLMLLVGTAQAVTIETVPVGNLGNAADTEVMWTDDTTGYGFVGYAYNIGKYEVTAGQYCEFLNAVAATDTYGLYNSSMDTNSYGCQITRNGDNGSYTYDFSGGTVEVPGSTAADWENRPVNYVSWGDAARFANWLHNDQPTGTLTGNPVEDAGFTEDGAYNLNSAMSDAELMAVTRQSNATWSIPSEDEWYKAAYHQNDGVTGNYFDFPTSNDSPPINTVVSPDPGNHANFWDFYGTGNGTHTIGLPYMRTEVGEFEKSESPYGTYDQGGNVWEWNEIAMGSSSRGTRGGSWAGDVNYNVNLLAASNRTVYSPTLEDMGIGFRVASVPEPSSIVLLLMEVAVLLMFRRR